MELTKTLLSYGLQQCKTDPCVFVKFEETQSKIEESQPKFEKTRPTVFVCVSTDDLLVATENEHWRKLAAYLSHDYQGRFKTSHADMEKECTSFIIAPFFFAKLSILITLKKPCESQKLKFCAFAYQDLEVILIHVAERICNVRSTVDGKIG